MARSALDCPHCRGARARLGGGARLAGAPRAARKMAALGAPLRTLRALLRELRHAAGRSYRDSPAYRHVLAAFRAHRVRAAFPSPPLSPRQLPGLGEASGPP